MEYNSDQIAGGGRNTGPGEKRSGSDPDSFPPGPAVVIFCLRYLVSHLPVLHFAAAGTGTRRLLPLSCKPATVVGGVRPQYELKQYPAARARAHANVLEHKNSVGGTERRRRRDDGNSMNDGRR